MDPLEHVKEAFKASYQVDPAVNERLWLVYLAGYLLSESIWQQYWVRHEIHD